MPRDIAGNIDTIYDTRDPFERLGIVPVPASYVKKHKADYMAKMRNLYKNRLEWRTARVSLCYSAGSIRRLGDEFKEQACGERSRRQILWTQKDVNYEIVPRVPQILVDLAFSFTEECPDATFSMDFLYTDPILNAHYKHHGKDREGCLGIWTYGKLEALAGPTPMLNPIPPPTKWWKFW